MTFRQKWFGPRNIPAISRIPPRVLTKSRLPPVLKPRFLLLARPESGFFFGPSPKPAEILFSPIYPKAKSPSFSLSLPARGQRLDKQDEYVEANGRIIICQKFFENQTFEESERFPTSSRSRLGVCPRSTSSASQCPSSGNCFGGKTGSSINPDLMFLTDRHFD